MPGTWLGRIGRRLLHRDTFDMMLVPAIADLQFELSTRQQPRGRAADYWAVLCAFCGALCFDVWRDLSALRSDADMIALLTLLQASYYTFMLVLLSGLGTGQVSALTVDDAFMARATSYVGAITAACLITSSICFWPSRRASASDTED